ncbi:MAG: hypothetical protein KAS07_01670 [Candidatus Pacebacteria bacterium]|nr:hypothetical protein [Candidatus Paceibacterota bacterium]
MKYLEIKDNKGYYWNGEGVVEIDKINKDDLLKLINHAEEDEFEMDAYNEEQLQNKAHQIIYQSIYTKLNDFLVDAEQFNRKVDALYTDAVGEYGADVEAETDEEDIEESEENEEEEINPEDIPF